MKRGHLAVLLLACIVITLMQGATISQAEDADRFAVSSIGVPEGYFIHAPRPSYQCGRIAAMCSQEQVLDDTTALVQYEVNEDELTQCFVFPIPVSQGFKAPVIVLDNGHFLMREYDPDVERTLDPRVGAVYSLVDIAAGTQEVVTPTNLVETTPWPHMGGVPTVWSEDYGMTMFIRELGSNQVVVWQGKETLSEVQRTPPVIASRCLRKQEIPVASDGANGRREHEPAGRDFRRAGNRK